LAALPASRLDEADPEGVQMRGDGELVRDRVGDSLALRTVAQARVVDVETVT